MAYSLPVAPTRASAAPSQDVAAVYSPRQQGLGLTSAAIISRSHTGILVFFPANATPLPAAPPAASTTPTAPSTSSAARPAPQAKTCAFGPCQLVKLHRLCPNQLCKRHCLEAGACAVYASPAPPPLPRKALPPLSGPSLEALSAVTQYAARIPQHVERTACEERERRRERAAELSLIPSPSPSPRHNQISPINNEFVLVHWSDNLHAPAVTAVQNPPSWPRWIFESKGPYQAYSTPYSSWMTVEASYIHTLSTGQPLLVRSLGVGAGVDEEEHIARAHAMPTPPIPRFLVQPLLPKSKGKRRAIQITPLPDSDDKVIIIEDPATSSRRRRRYSGSDDVEVVSPVPSRRPKRPRLTISTRTDSPVLSLTSSTSASSSILSTPSSPDFPAALLPTLYSYKLHH
ncbi:hypothetical protein B0H14DRAFT_2629079 [Mycena olivaceomarginata]|nr:hypothetical protein B0H14DRAFT_2629079 [Mycena olivaceomarginata]